MPTGSLIRGAMLAIGVWIALGLLRFKPWVRADASAVAKETLAVGFLPVT